MDVIVEFAEGFIGLFKAGAETLVGNITGILPLLAVIITVLNALMAVSYTHLGGNRTDTYSKRSTHHQLYGKSAIDAGKAVGGMSGSACG